MALTYVGFSAAVFGTTSATPAAVTGTAAGDGAFIVVTSKLSTTTPATPSGWTQIVSASVGTGTDGSAAGPVRLTVFFSEVPDTGLTMPAITTSGTGAAIATAALVWRKATSDAWQVNAAGATTGTRTTASTAYSITGAANIGLASGDDVLVLSGLTGTTPTFGTSTLAATGATISGLTERIDTSTTNGNDVKIAVHTADVTAGSETAAPTFTSTLSSSTGATGGSAIVRVRVAPMVQLAGSAGLTFDATGSVAVGWVDPRPSDFFFKYTADDAAATYGTATTTGGLVDSSGNVRPNLAPATSAVRPVLNVAGAGGHQYLTFDGIDDRLTTSNGTDSSLLAFGNAKPGLSVAHVVRINGPTEAAASRYVHFHARGGSTATRLGVFVNAAGFWTVAARRLDTDASTEVASAVLADNELHLVVAVADYAGTGEARLYLDGTLIASVALPGAIAPSSATNSLSWNVGSNATPAQWAPMDWYEGSGYDRVLSEAEIASHAGYAAKEYGITATPAGGAEIAADGSASLVTALDGTAARATSLAGSAALSTSLAGSAARVTPLAGSTGLATGNSAALTRVTPLAGSATLATGNSATPTRATPLAGSTGLVTDSTAALTRSTAAAGSVSLATDSTAALTRSTAAAGSASLATDSTAALTRSSGIAGAAGLVTSLTAAASRALSAAAGASISTGVAAAISRAATLSGAASVATGLAGTPARSAALSGSSGLVAGLSGTSLSVLVPLVGGASLAVALPDAPALVAGGFAGSAGLATAISGTAARALAAGGTAAARVSLAGTLSRGQALVAASSLAATAAGDALSVEARLIGSLALALTLDGQALIRARVADGEAAISIGLAGVLSTREATRDAVLVSAGVGGQPSAAELGQRLNAAGVGTRDARYAVTAPERLT